MTPVKSAEIWQALMELRCRREIIERWLSSGLLSEDVQRSLKAMLNEINELIENQLQSLSPTRSS